MNFQTSIRFFALICVVLLIGLIATRLNHIYYSVNAPFYDSSSYYNTLAKVVNDVKKNGVTEALKIQSNSTVFLPWVVGGVIGLCIPLSRDIGVWCQIIWLMTYALSIFYYLIKCRKLDSKLAATFVLPFLSLHAFYFFNGGLSDFRMDLHLYLLLSTAAVWYLVTLHTDRWYPWCLMGLFLGLSCLSRTTTPIYAVLMFGPLIAWRLLTGPKKIDLLLKCIITGLVVALIAGWFFFGHYDYLHYYYLVWNVDANARLPLAQSIRHIHFAIGSIGAPVLIFALFAFGVRYFNTPSTGDWPARLRSLHWEALYLGLAPVLFLVFRGAGLNPFVSMPGAFGLCLFILFPFKKNEDSWPALKQETIFGAALLTLFFSITLSLESHLLGSRNNLMAAHRKVIDLMQGDSAQQGKTKITFTTAFSYYLNTESIWNCLIYEYDFVPQKNRLRQRKNSISKGRREYEAAVPVEWNDLQGESSEEKLDELVEDARKNIDYLILPTDLTLGFLETKVSHNYINQFSRAFKTKVLATGLWEPLGEPVVNSTKEVVQIYRKIPHL